MKHYFISLREKRKDFAAKTLFFSALSAIVTAIFAVYNGVLWGMYGTEWNVSICIYYLCLVVIRLTILLTRSHSGASLRRQYLVTHLMLIFLNLTLVVPISLMVIGERASKFGLIPSIGMAAYTTWRITMCILNARRAAGQNNPVVTELRTINLIDALVAVLSLQNTLIMADGGLSPSMLTLSAWTSGGILLLILALTVRSFLRIRRM